MIFFPSHLFFEQAAFVSRKNRTLHKVGEECGTLVFCGISICGK